MVEPWSDNTRTYSNAAIRVALLDDGSPLRHSMFLLVLAPPFNELGERQCQMIGFEPSVGFFAIDFVAIDATYDPALGLTVNMPVEVFDADTAAPLPYHLFVTINQTDEELGVYTVPMYD